MFCHFLLQCRRDVRSQWQFFSLPHKVPCWNCFWLRLSWAFSVAGPTVWNLLPDQFIASNWTESTFRRHSSSTVLVCFSIVEVYTVMRYINPRFAYLLVTAFWFWVEKEIQSSVLDVLISTHASSLWLQWFSSCYTCACMHVLCWWTCCVNWLWCIWRFCSVSRWLGIVFTCYFTCVFDYLRFFLFLWFMSWQILCDFFAEKFSRLFCTLLKLIVKQCNNIFVGGLAVYLSLKRTRCHGIVPIHCLRLHWADGLWESNFGLNVLRELAAHYANIKCLLITTEYTDWVQLCVGSGA